MLTLFLGIPNEPAPFAKRKGARASEAPRAGDAQTPPLREARTQGVPAQTSVYDMTTASTNDRQQFTRFFHNILAQGIYLPPSPFEAWFVSLAHSDEDIEATIRAVRESL